MKIEACFVSYSVYGIRYTVYGMRYTVYGIRYTVCGMPTRCVFFVLKWLILQCRSVIMAHKALDEISGRYWVNETAYTVMAIAELYGKQYVAYRNRRGSSESDLSG